MTDFEELMRPGNELADRMEQYAEFIETAMPLVADLRERMTVVSSRAQELGLTQGSVDRLDNDIAEACGFNRIEAARRRIIAALADPMDEAPG